MTPESSFASFAAAIHARVPEGHVADLAEPQRVVRRAICGDHGRVIPTRQGLCPYCAGFVEDADD
jgi:hypothetical protein